MYSNRRSCSGRANILINPTGRLKAVRLTAWTSSGIVRWIRRRPLLRQVSSAPARLRSLFQPLLCVGGPSKMGLLEAIYLFKCACISGLCSI
ncbi:hypothetical protein TNIN_325461 [Trichonephila inaurata madagascariensis]|uniref:Uncharacterized protein n=1 Tax=Trichonephila inaurata madagascariensis TaxID=2747483 RepID=A0A8X6YBN9_9ARAC|nr:hypothetical protein TNIN_243661 [Trichonephila inaurata madagascariensis]GFY69308.1 hypothetical protein TNIN_325461 [Trichonephila inaurata madagascariensis]